MRLIDADELIEDVRKNSESYFADDFAKEWVDKQPTIEPQQRWIPCSERLPEGLGTVLITHRGGVSFAWWDGRYWTRGASTKHTPIKTVVAWMPLPEPYQERQADK